LVLNAVDLFSLRRSRQAQVTGRDDLSSEATELQRRELEMAALCDLVTVYSDVERRLLNRLLPRTPVEVAPWYAVTTPAGPGWDRREGVVFLGSYSHEPNLDAACYLVDTIMPLLRARGAGLRLHLYGSAMPDALHELAAEDVLVHGYAPRLEVLDAHRVFAAPLRFGAGIKGKVATALGRGLPAVLSTVAVEGFAIVAGREAAVADDPERFAATVDSLARDADRWQAMAAAARAFARRRFARQAGVARMRSILGALGLRV
jgi:glycosyltransferase involved in cell wall biosynthesis